MKRFYFLLFLVAISQMATAQGIWTTHWSEFEHSMDYLTSGLFKWDMKKEVIVDKEAVQVEWHFSITEDSTWYLVGDVFKDSAYYGHSIWVKVLEIHPPEIQVEGARNFLGTIARNMSHQVNKEGETVGISETLPDLAVEDTIQCQVFWNDKILMMSKSLNFGLKHSIFYDPELSSSLDYLYTFDRE